MCMFYFAHPFGGIATPSSTSYSIDPYAGMPTAEKTPNSKCKNAPNQQHLNDFTPWPIQTWQTRDLLSPLIQALQKQIGKRFLSVFMTFNISVIDVACNELSLLTYALDRPPKTGFFQGIKHFRCMHLHLHIAE